jgi:hypothetical protein
MTDLRKAAEQALEALETLWGILDDIDTASDMAKENDAWYRKRVEALQKKRWDTMIETDGYKLKGGPVEALRQALAQPEQEWDSRHPKAQALIGERARLRIELGLVERLVDDPHFETTPSDMEYWGPLHDKLEEALTQPKQEPVAWLWKNQDGHQVLTDDPDYADGTWIPLYTAPPKRKWVGLTHDEVNSWELPDCPTVFEFAQFIEAKLKEKNT